MASDEHERMRAVIMLRAACDTALQRFDEEQVEDFDLAWRIRELRDMLDDYLAEAAEAVSRRGQR